jgi:serine/threonine-protein kinase
MQFRELTDRYQLEKILKSNRFGTVLRATDSKSGRVVVVKQITVPSPERLVATAPEFEKLAAAVAGLGHPAFPTVLDSGFTTDGAAFLSLELLEGKGLDTFTGVPPAQVLTRIGQALEGLEALVAKGFAHLNLSPDNLFVARTPAGEQVEILGLGTAVFRPRGAAAAGAPAAENARFQAPEMAAGGAVDGRADLYSLALVTCHALGATVGFGESPVVQLPLAVSFELENDEALRQILERALRRNPAERPSARLFREALRLAAGEAPAAAAPISPAFAPPPFPVTAPPAPPVATVMPFTPPPPISPAPPVLPAPVAQNLAPLSIPDAWAPPGGPVTAGAAAAVPQLPEPAPLPPLGGAPEEPSSGEALSAVDDEMLNALLSVPAPAPRTPGAKDSGKVVPFLRKPGPPTGAVAVSVPAASRKPASRPLLRNPAVLGALALGLMALLAAGYWLFRRSSNEVVVEAPESAIALPKAPTRPPVEKLEEARLYLAQGEDLKARRVLRSIPWGEQGLLSPEGCRSLSAMQQNLALAALERLPSDLASALKAGDLEILQTAVEAGAGAEAGLAPDVRVSYDKARGIVDAYTQARAAATQGSYEQVLERFATVATLLPRMSDPENLRGNAAAALEAEADRLARDGKYAEGLARMEPIQRTWPERPGFKDRVARFQKYQQDEQQQEEILVALPNIERHKKPWDGLESMRGITPTPHLAQRFAEARARLEDLLARLDKEPPVLALRDGYLLDYARGTVANLSFRATDDYEVKDVKLLAKPEGGKFRELPLEKSRSGYYTVEIPPSFHQNGRVDFYVVATDLSGHEATLGSRDQPLQLKRKQGFEQLIR